jgi:DNA polymerase-4
VRSAPTILHADLDAFYASVEQLLDPSLRGRPVAVGGGVVLAASYEARAHGVRAGMPGWRARRLCPDLRVVGGHFREYQRLGDAVMDVLRDVTPLVERISIDEAFCDVAGAVRLFGAPERIATDVRRRVRAELGLPLSIGAARTKHLAKIASQVAKPDGLVVVDPARERAFLDPLPVGLVWGIGPVTEARLAARGIRTIGELAACPGGQLEALLGAGAGAKLGALAANDDERRVRPHGRAGSVGAQSALGRREPTPELVRVVLGRLVDRVGRRLRSAGRAGRTVTVRVRFADLRAVTRSVTLPEPIATTLTIVELGVELVAAALADHPDEPVISLLGVSVGNLAPQPGLQLTLPIAGTDPRHPGSRRGAARWATDVAMDRVRARFGTTAVGYASMALADGGGVPDEFRELAEHDL